MDRYRYYRSILSVMLATDSIDLSVKNFSFLTDSINHRSENKNFSSIKSYHRLKIFFSSKDHRCNRYFLQLIDYRYRSNRCFFRHRCPSMVRRWSASWCNSPFIIMLNLRVFSRLTSSSFGFTKLYWRQGMLALSPALYLHWKKPLCNLWNQEICILYL
jgi:hypothetical protein